MFLKETCRVSMYLVYCVSCICVSRIVYLASVYLVYLDILYDVYLVSVYLVYLASVYLVSCILYLHLRGGRGGRRTGGGGTGLITRTPYLGYGEQEPHT